MNADLQRQRFAKEDQLIKAMYTLLPVGKEQVCSAKDLADIAGLPGGVVSRYVKNFISIGILSRRLTVTPMQGKTAHWTLLMEESDAEALLKRDQEQRFEQAHVYKKRKPRKAKVVETTVAIVGPDAPTLAEAMPKAVRDLRKDESGALIAATKQYVARKDTALGKLRELADTMTELGIKFDFAKAAGSMHFEEDERLETVALVLPYVEQLERVNEDLARKVTDMRPKVAKHDTLQADVDRLSQRVERLVSQQTASNPN